MTRRSFRCIEGWRVAALATVLVAIGALRPHPLSPSPIAPPSTGRGGTTTQALEDSGRRLYREGLLSSGALLRGALPDGAFVEGVAASCSACHRRSGFGGVEGTVYIPPVTGPALFAPASPDRNVLFRRLFEEKLDLASRTRLLAARDRPAYTPETLAVALSEGHDPAGRAFAAPMPRYRLGAEDLEGLTAYLRTLAAAPSPGVEDDEIHFATVLTPGADRERGRAVLDVAEAWVRRKNADLDRRRQRPGAVGPTDEDLRFAERHWVLHVWEPQGPPETWTAQLAAWNAERPVFAVLGGLSGPDEPWAPVHAFCESAEVPCLFPETDLPVTTSTGAMTFYFSGGRVQEAEALARYLRETGGGERLFLSSTLLGEPPPEIPAAWRNRTLLLHRRALPGLETPQAFRIRAWLRARGIAPRHEPLQLDAYFTWSLAEEAVLQLAGHFSRDLFVENVERETERLPDPGVWPPLVLAPGRRIASRGTILLRPDPAAPGGWAPASGWIVP